MSLTIWVVGLLTFVIHFVGTIIYAVRIVGVRTRKIAVSGAIFNVFGILSRIASTLQAPLLAKLIEHNILSGIPANTPDFRFIMLFASLATVAGGLAIPTAHRLIERAVENLYRQHSMTHMLLRGLSPRTIRHLAKEFVLPQRANFNYFKDTANIPWKVIGMNVVVNAFVTVTVLSCLYAGYLNPDLRSTTASMNGIANSIAVVISLIFVDPYIAILTDEVLIGHKTQAYFRKMLVYVIVARFAGTLFAQLLLIPTAYLIVWVAEYLL